MPFYPFDKQEFIAIATSVVHNFVRELSQTLFIDAELGNLDNFSGNNNGPSTQGMERGAHARRKN